MAYPKRSIADLTSTTAALLLIANFASSQQLLIVDLLQRPGTTHSDLPAAVAASAPSDWIWVRNTRPVATSPLSYTAPVVTHALTILGEEWNGTRPDVAGIFTVSGIAAGHSVTIGSLRFQAPWGSNATPTGFQATNNTGALLLLNLVMDAPATYSIVSRPVRFVDCADVTLNGCTIASTIPGNEVVRSRLRVQNSRLSSPAYSLDLTNWMHAPGGAGLDLQDSEVWLTRSTILASGWTNTNCRLSCVTTSAQGRPAIVLSSASRATVGPGSTLIGRRDWFYTWSLGSSVTYGIAVLGPGTLLTDPNWILMGSVQSPQTTAHVPETNILLARFGGAASIEVSSEPGAFALVAAGHRLSTPWSTALGDLWLDPTRSFILGVAALNAQGQASFVLPMTASVPFGAHIGVQSALLLPSAAMTLSQPAFSANLPPGS